MPSFSGTLSFILFLQKEQGESQSILTGENDCSCLGFRCPFLWSRITKRNYLRNPTVS